MQFYWLKDKTETKFDIMIFFLLLYGWSIDCLTDSCLTARNRYFIFNFWQTKRTSLINKKRRQWDLPVDIETLECHRHIHQYNWSPRNNWNIVECGVKHYNPKPTWVSPMSACCCWTPKWAIFQLYQDENKSHKRFKARVFGLLPLTAGLAQ